MPIHVAILKRPYLDLILTGVKTVESRLTRTSMPPYRDIEPGERIFLKESAGPFRATAVAGRVRFLEKLTPAGVETLRREYQATVGGDSTYWRAKRDSRFATFVELTHVEPLDVGPTYRKVNMKAWHVLDDQASPLREVTITGGAIRNGYGHFPWGAVDGDGAGLLELVLPDGQVVRSDLARGRMIRWRGWRRYYEHHQVQPGDVMRFVAVRPRRYLVSFRAAAR